ncbi:MAG: integration host factor subunit beta, partial [Desulfobacca sp.]|nr:integration host factor subunit beta [Desulfobacca sp.]
ARGERIDIRDFGNFTVRMRTARQARNPRTTEAVKLNERRVPFFKVGKELKERVAGKGHV